MAKKRASRDPSEPQASIESAMEELQQIVDSLEAGNAPLGASLEKFERGMALLKICHEQLDHAAQRIEVLTRMTPDGEITTAPFDATSTMTRKSTAEIRFSSSESDRSEDADDEDGVDPASLF